MPRFRVTIRASLLFVAGLLGAAVIGLTGLGSYRALDQMRQSARVAESNRTADLLLTAAGNWAVERGIVNAALAAPEAAATGTRAAFGDRRRSADTALAEALERIAAGPDFMGRDDLVRSVRSAQYLPDTAQTSILMAQDVKHQVWAMSEYAGRESAPSSAAWWPPALQ